MNILFKHLKVRCILALLCIFQQGIAQTNPLSITTSPALPVASQPVTITFDSSKDLRLGSFTGDLYAHTGVIIEGNTAWMHVIGKWGENTNQPKLLYKGGGMYELVISPDIKTFYSVPGTEKVKKMAFVFRSTDSGKQTSDLFVDVYSDEMDIHISSPANNSIIDINETFTITAASSVDASFKVKVGDVLLAESVGKNITTQYAFSESGWKTIIAEAVTTEKTVFDSVRVFIKDPVTVQPKPQTYRNGINYTGDHSVALVLWAPAKENVFVVGDFNGWEVHNNFQMKKDGDYFWLEINGLTKGLPYVFQYLIDGQMHIADPYTEQTSDPNDVYISNSTYPGLLVYPSGKAEGVASVLQTGQVPYSWEIQNFTPPATEKLIIYEMLVRDFTKEHTYLAVIEKLDYLKTLGINVLELMPINEFEGNESWGYNPSFYFAPDKYYGPRNTLKKLVDECHKRGIAVVIDMVLNHSYGQSPLVKMYWDYNNNRPAANNPWYRTQSNFENPGAQWGYDFNHDNTATRLLIDSINSYWMKEYKVDGFRFDFTKGFSNTPWIGTGNWGSAYDASRIANLKRMADEIWTRKDKALVIFEHLSDNLEEKELADYGILLWGNMSGKYSDGAMGYHESSKSDLTWGIYSNRSWKYPNLISYMESHDEDRLVYKCLHYGKIEGDYNTMQLNTALDRAELSSLFFLPLPGPKMIWQFGELGYDFSINTCEDTTRVSNECRLSPKPIVWDYVNETNRQDLYNVMARLNYLKKNYEEFSASSVFSGNLIGETKWYRLSSGANHVVAVGNFATSPKSVTVNFPVTGTWNDYFDGGTLAVTSTSHNIILAAGEYLLLSNRLLDDPTHTPLTTSTSGKFRVYPNPARDKITVQSDNPLGKITIRNLLGQILFMGDFGKDCMADIRLHHFSPGLYLVNGGEGEKGSLVKLIIF